ncbi:hypothetical protein Tco_0879446 [Tanacetum coccineum]
MKNRTTQSPKHQLPEQNPEKGTEAGIPEAHHHTPVYSKDSRRTDPLHRSPGRGEKGASQRIDVETRRRQQRQAPSRATSQYSESEDSEGGHWKSKLRRQKSNTYEDDLYQA